MFTVKRGNLIINILLVQWRFLLNIVGANRVDIFINYKAAFKDQFNSIFEIIAIIKV